MNIKEPPNGAEVLSVLKLTVGPVHIIRNASRALDNPSAKYTSMKNKPKNSERDALGGAGEFTGI